MSLQLLCRYDVADFETWRQAFDASAEARDAAGLTLLQIWRDADRPARAFALFEVHGRGRAQGFVNGAGARLLAERGGVTGTQAHFLETA